MYNHDALKQLVNFSIEAREQQGHIVDSVKDMVKSIEESDCFAWIKEYRQNTRNPRDKCNPMGCRGKH